MNYNSSLILRSDEEDVWQEDQAQHSLERTLEKQEKLMENFKKLWYEKYLLSLRECSRNVYQTSWENRAKVDDIVLIKTPNKSRLF